MFGLAYGSSPPSTRTLDGQVGSTISTGSCPAGTGCSQRCSSSSMASCNLSSLAHRFHFISKTPFSPSTPRTKTLTLIPRISNVHHSTSPTAIQTHSFTWDDVLRIPQTDENPPSDLGGYFGKVRLCNRGSVSRRKKTTFLVILADSNLFGFGI